MKNSISSCSYKRTNQRLSQGKKYNPSFYDYVVKDDSAKLLIKGVKIIKIRNKLGNFKYKEKTPNYLEWREISKDKYGNYYLGQWNFYTGQKEGAGIMNNKNTGLYEGYWKYNKYNGEGRKIYIDGSYYVGSWKDGKRHGKGSYIELNGSKYHGEWKYDKKHGIGVDKNNESEDIYEGRFNNGERCGPGILRDNECKIELSSLRPKGSFRAIERYKNGARYEGEMLDNNRHGYGVYYFSHGAQFEGNFIKGDAYGFGRYTFPSGAYYEGEYSKDKRNSKGTKVDANGDKYIGEFKNDEKCGQGTYIWNNGDIYSGEWKDDACFGHGCLEYANGDKYTGEFMDNSENGYGTYVWSSGDIYSGGWKEGLRHGHGTMIWASGRIYTGGWRDGKIFGIGTLKYKDKKKLKGNFTCKENNRNNKKKLYYKAN